LNNLDTSCEYIGKLAKDLEADAADSVVPDTLSKIQSALSSMKEEGNSFKQVLQVSALI
jgi:hypothetical protein